MIGYAEADVRLPIFFPTYIIVDWVLGRCRGASRPAPGDGQGAEGLESDEARGISGAHAQAVPIRVGCHKGVAELEDGRLQNHRNAQCLPLCVKTIDVGTLDVAET